MKTIPLGSRKYPGRVALIDDDDYEFISQHNWTVRRWGDLFYAVRGIPHPSRHGRTTTSMHNVLTGWRQVDHINHDGLDNRRCNLREATKAQNAHNMRSHRDAISPYKGVSWFGRDMEWDAYIKVNGHRQYLGRFADEEDAARAYDAAALAAWGEYAYLNFPPESGDTA